MTSIIAPYLPEIADIATLAATLAVALSFIGLGTLLCRPVATLETRLLSGWGFAVAAVTVVGTLTALRLGWVLFPLLGLGGVGFAVGVRRSLQTGAADAVRLILVALPLLLVVSAASASQWDEFAHWLLNQRYLVDIGTFPRRDLPESASGFAAYPYGLALIGFAVSRLTGSFVENAGALFNTLLIPFLGAAALRAFRSGASEAERDRPITWSGAAAALAVATLLNPVFVPKLAFTTYADWTTTVVLGAAALMAWRIVEQLAEGERVQAIGDALPLGFVLALAIGLKQPNVIPGLLLLLGMGLAVALGPRVHMRDWMHLALRVALPGLIVYFAWRHHVAQNIPGREFGFMPIADWLWDDLGAVLGRMLLIASKKGGYFGLMLLAAGTAVYAIVSHRAGTALSPAGRLSVIVAVVFLGYNAFLYVAYIGAFGRGEGLSAASYWRYNTQLGGIALVFGAAMAGRLWPKLRPRLAAPAWIRPAVVAIALIVPVAAAPKIRFDLNPVTRYVRSVGVEMNGLMPLGARLVVIDPTDNGKRALLLRYELAGRGRVDRWSGADVNDPAVVRRTLASLPSSYLWVHVPTPLLSDALAVDLAPLSSHLVEPTSTGWRIVRSWPYPGYLDPAAEDD
jgi:hypothetical protein